jgi:hypothetical protein
MDNFNHGSGLTDITASMVSSDYVITSDINSEGGQIDFNYNNLVHVNLINGYNLTTINDRSIYGSNTAYYGSNTSYWGSNTATWASNNLVKNSNVVTVSNLSTSNVNLNTLQRNGSNTVGTDGKIDYSWLKNAPAYSNNDSMDIAGIVLGSLGIVSGAGAILTQTGAGEVLIDDLKNRVGNNEIDDTYDPDQAESENLKVHWNNIIYKPIYQNIGKEEVGFKSNVYIAKGSKISYIDKNDLVAYDNGRTKRIAVNTANVNTIFDTETSTLVSKYILCSSNVNVGALISVPLVLTSNILTSNITASNTVTACNILTSNITVISTTSTNNLEVTKLKVGNFYVTASGIYIGDPSNPFTSAQVIDASGVYKNSINKEQITNLEALNLNQLVDGNMQWGGFQSSTTNPLFENPFRFDYNALFEVL